MKDVLITLAILLSFYFIAVAIKLIFKRGFVCPICFAVLASFNLGFFTGLIPTSFLILLAGMGIVSLADEARRILKAQGKPGYDYAKSLVLLSLITVALFVLEVLGYGSHG